MMTAIGTSPGRLRRDASPQRQWCKIETLRGSIGQGTVSARGHQNLRTPVPKTPTKHRTVSTDRPLVDGWFVDVALAYLGGLMIGAPTGLAATWYLRHDLALTIVIVLAMLGVLVSLRRRRRRILN